VKGYKRVVSLIQLHFICTKYISVVPLVLGILIGTLTSTVVCDAFFCVNYLIGFT
jgi:hypothetical protein